jgi:hypothetical protein
MERKTAGGLEARWSGDVPRWGGPILQPQSTPSSQSRSLQETDPMTRTVASLFSSEELASAAVGRLEQVGIPTADIDIWSSPHNLAPLLEDAGVSRAEAYAFVEGVVQGGTVVIVSCPPEVASQVAGILKAEGAPGEQPVLQPSEPREAL